MQSSIDQARLK